ncbi:MAG TPA: nuclear transport factor 2 family protein [Rhizomicrobium sp.]|jgi:ketosteroid isomerase-like protein|nr:nuclear transport factor 2 family protein [Rhizomicrobium sp.]
MRLALSCSIAAIAVGVPLSAIGHPSTANSGAAIQALEDQFAAAVRAKDVDAIMKVYGRGSDLFVFDLVPPRQYVGAEAYRKDWKAFLDTFKGPIKFTISDLAVDAAGKMAYSHSVQRMNGTDRKGKSVDFTVRVTDIYRKMGGDWRIVHEHVSVPVNMDTGKPDMTSSL